MPTIQSAADAGRQPASVACPATLIPVEADRYTIYCVRERTTDRPYVGLTKRTLQARVVAHVYQSRRECRVRPGGLLQAIRDAEARGKAFEQSFDVAILETAPDVDTARALEVLWIDRLQARCPIGFNLMPGGASVGGPANAKAVVVEMPGQPPLSWLSIDAAIRAVNKVRSNGGKPTLAPPAVYMRLQSGWSAAEALELAPRVDRRSVRRTPVRIGGVMYFSLRHASAATGISPGALRSRLSRVMGPAIDIGVDRRHLNSAPRCRELVVICPKTGDEMCPTTFAKREGLPKATVLRRWRQALTAGLDPKQATGFIAFLKAVQERRKVISLVLPDGSTWTGGYRDLVRRLLAHPHWEAQRGNRLGESRIRARLRGLSRAERTDPNLVRNAFGFGAAHDVPDDQSP